MRCTSSMKAMTPTATINEIHFAPICTFNCASERLVKRWVRMYHASSIEFALKKIHALVTTVKVKAISRRWVSFGSFTKLVALKNVSLSGFARRSKINNAPWMAPQTTNVQAAPCHNPDSRKTIAILRCHLGFEVRLPPKGM